MLNKSVFNKEVNTDLGIGESAQMELMQHPGWLRDNVRRTLVVY